MHTYMYTVYFIFTFKTIRKKRFRWILAQLFSTKGLDPSCILAKSMWGSFRMAPWLSRMDFKLWKGLPPKLLKMHRFFGAQTEEFSNGFVWKLGTPQIWHVLENQKLVIKHQISWVP